MKKLFAAIIIIYLLAGGVLYVRSATNPCNRVLSYGMGTYDPRFGITQDQFLKVVQDMESVWEESLDRELFKHDPDAKFKINLVFDERQQRTINERNARQTIDLNEQSYDKLVSQHNILSFQYQQQLVEYNEAKAGYEKRLSGYNAEVKKWNSQGGAPSEDYKRLQAEKKALASVASSLETQRLALNIQVANINALADRINVVAKNLNKDVDAYNGKFGEPRQFDQGTYTGDAINIFQFNEEADLRLVVAHEFGHALKLEHIDDPKAVMYYLMDEQDLKNIHLSDGDLAAIKTRCNIR